MRCVISTGPVPISIARGSSPRRVRIARPKALRAAIRLPITAWHGTRWLAGIALLDDERCPASWTTALLIGLRVVELERRPAIGAGREDRHEYSNASEIGCRAAHGAGRTLPCIPRRLQIAAVRHHSLVRLVDLQAGPHEQEPRSRRHQDKSGLSPVSVPGPMSVQGKSLVPQHTARPAPPRSDSPS